MKLYKKYLLIIDSIILLGSLLSIFLIVGYTQPLVIAPIPLENENLLFSIPKTDYILIDDNSRFDSPTTLFLDGEIVLEEGRYFIKFFNGLSSEVRQIDLELTVTLEFKSFEDKVGVFNVGESLLVETYDKGSLVDSNLVYSGDGNE